VLGAKSEECGRRKVVVVEFWMRCGSEVKKGPIGVERY
jgi:hypothetical protein